MLCDPMMFDLSDLVCNAITSLYTYARYILDCSKSSQPSIIVAQTLCSSNFINLNINYKSLLCILLYAKLYVKYEYIFLQRKSN